jgi:hypothetical protein
VVTDRNEKVHILRCEEKENKNENENGIRSSKSEKRKRPENSKALFLCTSSLQPEYGLMSSLKKLIQR